MPVGPGNQRTAQAEATSPVPEASQEPVNIKSLRQIRERRATARMPGEDLSIAESLRVMDVARELRNQRETAEGMFRRDSVRRQLKEKLLATAKVSGEDVTEAEIEAAIDHHLANLHTYAPPAKGWRNFLATCWVERDRVAVLLVTVAAAIAWFTLF